MGFSRNGDEDDEAENHNRRSTSVYEMKLVVRMMEGWNLVREVGEKKEKLRVKEREKKEGEGGIKNLCYYNKITKLPLKS